MKKLLILFFTICFISLASAQGCDSAGWKGYGKLNENKTITVTCTTCNFINFSLTNPNGEITIINDNMVKSGSIFSYELVGSLLDTIGTYQVDGYSQLDTPLGLCFDINPVGDELNQAQSYLLVLVSFLIILALGFSVYGIIHASNGAWQIFYLCLGYLLLFSLFFLMWITSKNYLYDTPILSSIFWITWLILAFGFFPFVIFMSSYILLKEAELLAQEDLMKQGYDRDEAKTLSKSRKK